MSVSDFQKQQADIWNGQMGANWVETHSLTDDMLSSTLVHLVQAVTSNSPQRVLDIGCGNGATTAAIAGAQDGQGRSVGIDLSRAMIANATTLWSGLSDKVSFIADDAGTHDFGTERFDHFSSRFGTMFFADQTAAFSHLRRFASDGASMYLITWRSPEENSFLTTGPRVVASVLGPQPPGTLEAPGPFAMSDPDSVRTMLTGSGWVDTGFEALDLKFSFRADDMDTFMTKLAPLGPAVAEADEAKQARIFDLVRSEYRASIEDGRLVYDAACWAVTARAG
ncbi:MAG: class I SAM-dependent methyltransferase [Pseudomonadota bacterium]